MKILTLNCGSSTLKFSLFETSRAAIAAQSDEMLIRGSLERIGHDPSMVKFKKKGESKGEKKIVSVKNHQAAIKLALEIIQEAFPGKIDAVGHRVVHGGPKLGRSCIIREEIEKEIEKCIDLAPLHNPHNLAGIHSVQKILPKIPNVAAFDTGFHRTIPLEAALYAIPRDLAKKHAIRRYGFHGLSHRYMLYRLERLCGKSRKKMNVISCHLGNGCSITAVSEGKSVETSMGFTPCEGLVMGTRPGDLDVGALLYLMDRESLSITEAESFMNRRSGLIALSRVSNDVREILAARADGNEDAVLAIRVFCHRLLKYLGAYAAVLGKVDAIAFTGGISENLPEIRERVLEGLKGWGIKLDEEANELTVGREGKISAKRSAASIWVIPTDEELVIARDTVRCVEDADRMKNF